MSFDDNVDLLVSILADIGDTGIKEADTIAVNGSVFYDVTKGEVWVQEPGKPATTAIIGEMSGVSVLNVRSGYPVRIGYPSKSSRLTILGIGAYAREAGGGLTPNDMDAARATTTQLSAIVYLQISPSDPNDLTISLRGEYGYIHPLYNSQVYISDLSVSLASEIAGLSDGQHKIVLPYLDRRSNPPTMLSYIAGTASAAPTTVPYRASFSLTDVLPLKQQLPSFALPGRPVYLYKGQGSVTISDFLNFDMRDLFPPLFKHNLTANRAPDANDDETEGYVIGSHWVFNAAIYVCTDPSNGAANWEQTNGAGGGDFMADGSVPMTGDFDADGNDLNNVSLIDLLEGSAPSTPASGHGSLYEKTDGRIYFKNDGGTEYDLTDTTSGAGSNVDYGAYGSRPAAGNAGALYYTSDSQIISVDDGAAWHNFFGGKEVYEPPSAGWTWENQGTATITTTGGGELLYVPGNATANVRARIISAPSTPYVITAAFLPTVVGGASSGEFGLLFRESGSGKLHVLTYLVIPNQASKLGSRKFSASSSPGVGEYSLIVWDIRMPLLWMRIADNGTNRICSLSADGINFLDFHSVSRTDSITADQVGWWGMTTGTSANMYVHLLSWEVT